LLGATGPGVDHPEGVPAAREQVVERERALAVPLGERRQLRLPLVLVEPPVGLAQTGVREGVARIPFERLVEEPDRLLDGTRLVGRSRALRPSAYGV
jgi:hypothetical protein